RPAASATSPRCSPFWPASRSCWPPSASTASSRNPSPSGATRSASASRSAPPRGRLSPESSAPAYCSPWLASARASACRSSPCDSCAPCCGACARRIRPPSPPPRRSCCWWPPSPALPPPCASCAWTRPRPCAASKWDRALPCPSERSSDARLRSSSRFYPFAQFTLVRHTRLGPLDLAIGPDQDHFGYSANAISLPHHAFCVDKRRESDVVRPHEVPHVVGAAQMDRDYSDAFAAKLGSHMAHRRQFPAADTARCRPKHQQHRTPTVGFRTNAAPERFRQGESGRRPIQFGVLCQIQ